MIGLDQPAQPVAVEAALAAQVQQHLGLGNPIDLWLWATCTQWTTVIACSRARDDLWAAWFGAPSPFLNAVLRD